MKKALALGAVALALAGCAGTYYGDGYGYGPTYDPYYYGGYGGSGYYYYDNGGQRHWHDGGHRGDGRDWNGDRGDRGDRPGRDWNRGGESIGNPRSFHGEPGNEASTTGGGGGHGGGYSQQ